MRDNVIREDASAHAETALVDMIVAAAALCQLAIEHRRQVQIVWGCTDGFDREVNHQLHFAARQVNATREQWDRLLTERSYQWALAHPEAVVPS